jgi:hypothetical protein
MDTSDIIKAVDALSEKLNSGGIVDLEKVDDQLKAIRCWNIETMKGLSYIGNKLGQCERKLGELKKEENGEK